LQARTGKLGFSESTALILGGKVAFTSREKLWQVTKGLLCGNKQPVNRKTW
jgi:hypothetical protein